MYDLGGDMPNMWLRNSSMLYDPQSEGRVQVDDSVDALGPRCPPTIDEVEHSAAYEIACRYFLLLLYQSSQFCSHSVCKFWFLKIPLEKWIFLE